MVLDHIDGPSTLVIPSKRDRLFASCRWVSIRSTYRIMSGGHLFIYFLTELSTFLFDFASMAEVPSPGVSMTRNFTPSTAPVISFTDDVARRKAFVMDLSSPKMEFIVALFPTP